jgi:lipoate-protein ligase A
MSKELGRLTVAHLLEREYMADALLSRGAQPPYELGPQRGVRVSFGRRGDYILYICGIPMVQLRDYVAELGLLAVDADLGKLRLVLGEPHGWPLGPEGREPHRHSRYLC